MKRLAAAAAVLWVTPVFAGVSFTVVSQAEHGTSAVTIRIEGARMRVDPSPQSYVVWNGGERELRVVQVAEREFMRIDEGAMKRIGERLKVTQATLKQQLAALPKEQRAEFEAALKGLPMEGSPDAAPPAKPKPWAFKALGKKAQVNGMECQRYLGSRPAESVEACVVPWDKSPVKKEDLRGMNSLGDFAKGMAAASGIKAPTGEVDDDLDTYPGFPIEMVRTQGPMTSTVRIKDLKREALEGGLFEVPNGFKERSMGAGEDGPTGLE